MNSFITVTLAIMALVAVNVQMSEQAEIGGDLISTLRITAKLCLCAKNKPTVPQNFFACYEEPSKAIFVKCQQQAFDGKTLNNLDNIKYACTHAWKLPTYASCLKTEFAAAGINQDEAVTKVNKCQGQVVGI